jgi:prophage antirepressor-like protein
MNELQVFNYGEQKVRTVTIEGEPHWILADVCKVLGISGTTRVAQRLDEDEVYLNHLTDTQGKHQEMYVVNESGLYSVILRSDKPEAKAFKRWITHEVLPSIRKTGGYISVSDSDALREMKELDELNARVESKKKALCQRLVDGSGLSYGLSKVLWEYLQNWIGTPRNPQIPLAFPPMKEEV